MSSPEIAPEIAHVATCSARWKPLALRIIITVVALAVWFWTQALLGARPGGSEAIGDGLHRLTAPLHDYLAGSLRAANVLLIVSSLGIDALGIFLLGSWVFAGKLRPFVGLAMLLILRQIMWSAITRGFDSQPPLFYLLERACLKLPIAKQIALRLPSIPAFPLFLIFVFMYVQRRSREIIACLCAHLFLSTSLLQTYQTEARGYCLMMACIAFALVCCQMLPSVRWTALLLRPTGLWESRSFSRSSSPRLLRLILLN